MSPKYHWSSTSGKNSRGPREEGDQWYTVKEMQKWAVKGVEPTASPMEDGTVTTGLNGLIQARVNAASSRADVPVLGAGGAAQVAVVPVKRERSVETGGGVGGEAGTAADPAGAAGDDARGRVASPVASAGEEAVAMKVMPVVEIGGGAGGDAGTEADIAGVAGGASAVPFIPGHVSSLITPHTPVPNLLAHNPHTRPRTLDPNLLAGPPCAQCSTIGGNGGG